MKLKAFLLLFLALPLGLWGGYRLLHPFPILIASRAHLVDVSIESFQEEIRGIGELIPRHEHWVIAESGGIIRQTLAQAGDQVNKDSPLLLLANPTLEDSHQQAVFQWQQARAERLSTQADLDIQIEGLESELAMARLEYEVRQQLRQKQAVSELETRKHALEVEILQRRLDRTRQAAKAKNEAAEIRVEQRRQAMEAAKRKVEALTLRAGAAGLLLKMEQSWKPGMTVKEGQTIAQIATDEQLLAEIRIPVIAARELSPEIPVEIDSRQHRVTGRIRHVLPAVENDERVVEVELPAALPPSFRPNQPVSASILQGTEKVLTMPDHPALSSNDQPLLFRLTPDGWLEAVKVRLGRRSQGRVEILSGLKQGDKVLPDPPEKWRHEKRIKLQNR